MTTLTVVDGQHDETRPEAVARRLRGELGQLNLSISEVARRTGMSQPALSRRMTGQIPFDVAELDLVCSTLNISYEYVTTGIREVDPPPNPPQRGNWQRVDSAPRRTRTSDLRIIRPLIAAEHSDAA